MFSLSVQTNEHSTKWFSIPLLILIIISQPRHFIASYISKKSSRTTSAEKMWCTSWTVRCDDENTITLGSRFENQKMNSDFFLLFLTSCLDFQGHWTRYSFPTLPCLLETLPHPMENSVRREKRKIREGREKSHAQQSIFLCCCCSNYFRKIHMIFFAWAWKPNNY